MMNESVKNEELEKMFEETLKKGIQSGMVDGLIKASRLVGDAIHNEFENCESGKITSEVAVDRCMALLKLQDLISKEVNKELGK